MRERNLSAARVASRSAVLSGRSAGKRGAASWLGRCLVAAGLAGVMGSAGATPAFSFGLSYGADASTSGATAGGTGIFSQYRSGPPYPATVQDGTPGIPGSGTTVLGGNLDVCGGPCPVGPEVAGNAHASPGGDSGAYSYASVSGPILSPDYTGYSGVQDAVTVDSSASFSNYAQVKSLTNPFTGKPYLTDGTPVQVRVDLSLDGAMNLGAQDFSLAYASPGGYTASSDVSANFRLYDPFFTVTESPGVPLDLLTLSADVNGTDTAYGASQDIPYNEFNVYYSLSNSNNDNLGYANTSDVCDEAAVSDPLTCSGLYRDFSSGLLTATIDTFIGHTLVWNGSLDVLNQAYGVSAYAVSDFGHTFGANLNPTSSQFTLAFAYPQQSSVQSGTAPEPATLYLMGLAAPVLVRRRRSKA